MISFESSQREKITIFELFIWLKLIFLVWFEVIEYEEKSKYCIKNEISSFITSFCFSDPVSG